MANNPREYDPEINDIADYVANKPIDSELAVSPLPLSLLGFCRFSRETFRGQRPVAGCWLPNAMIVGSSDADLVSYSSTQRDGFLWTPSVVVSRA